MGESRESWLTLELQDRRYITIIEGEGELPASAEPTPSPRIDIDAAWLRWAPLAIPLLVTPFGLPMGVAVAMRWLAAKRPDREQVNVLPVPRRFVGAADFGPQGWETGIVYAANPKKPSMYRPLATFQEDLLLHKIAELERLINGLGAREYEILHTSGKVSAAGGLLSLASMGGSEASGQRSRLTERHWGGTSDGHEPAVPVGMVWYDSESEWQNLAESRLSSSRRQFSFSVRQNHDFGVDAKLAASVVEAGLQIGGFFRSVERVEFAVSGSF
jgi:hypothetical protein